MDFFLEILQSFKGFLRIFYEFFSEDILEIILELFRISLEILGALIFKEFISENFEKIFQIFFGKI